MRSKTGLLLSLLLSFSAIAEPELKGSPNELKQFLYPADKLITITAKADKTAYSDLAIVSLVVTTERKKLSDAMTQNSSIRQQINAKLETSGISQNKINSSKFSSSPEFGWFGDEPKSYKVVNRMAVEVSSAEQLNDVAKIADEFKQASLSGSEFKHSNKDELIEEVKQLALTKALKQKSVYETSLGLKLQPVAVRELRADHGATQGASELERMVFVARKARGDYMSEKAEIRRPSTFEETKYHAVIQVDFKIIE